MTEPVRPRIKIGGKTYGSLDDLPPEARQKLEQMLGQMRASGALEDKNRDGVPDRFESMLKVIGWVGKLTGKPHLKDKLTRQIQDQLHALGAASEPALPPRDTPPAGGTAQSRVVAPRAVTSSAPVAVRSNEDPRNESAAAEFIRKLVIVSILVGLGYAAYRLLR